MQSLFGIQLPQAAQYLLAFAIVIGLVALFGLLLRRLTGGRLRLSGANAPRARQPRLGIVDIYDLDRQRQLVLLRRDNIEHLLMIGGPNDVVVETNIVRVAARAPAPSSESDRAMAPFTGMDAEPEMLDAPESRAVPAPRRAPDARQPEVSQPEPRQPEPRQPEPRLPEPRQPAPRPAPVYEPARAMASPPAPSLPVTPPPPLPSPMVERITAAANPMPAQPVAASQPPRPIAPPARPTPPADSPVMQPASPIPVPIAAAKAPEPLKPNPLDDMAQKMEEALRAPFAKATPDMATPTSAVMGPPPMSGARVEPALTPAASMPLSPRSSMPVDGAVAAVAAALAMSTSSSQTTGEEVRPPQRNMTPSTEAAAPPLEMPLSKTDEFEIPPFDQVVNMDRAPLRPDSGEAVRPPRKAEPEIQAAPAQTAPAQGEPKADDPFSIEAIEAEFARLLGRTTPKD